MNIAEAIALVEGSGYRVVKTRKPRAKAEKPTLNVLGKPISPQYDPNWKMRMKLTSINRLFAASQYMLKDGKPVRRQWYERDEYEAQVQTKRAIVKLTAGRVAYLETDNAYMETVEVSTVTERRVLDLEMESDFTDS